MYVDNNNKNQYVCACIDLIIYSFIFHRLLCQQEYHHQNFSESKIFGIKNILVIYPPNQLIHLQFYCAFCAILLFPIPFFKSNKIKELIKFLTDCTHCTLKYNFMFIKISLSKQFFLNIIDIK